MSLVNYEWFRIMNNKNVAAILVTFNPDISLLERVIEKISLQVASLIIIDNASKNTLAISNIVDSTKNATLILNELNIGLASAQNLGIKKALDSKVTHIILFDQDSIINDHFIHNLIETEDNILSKGIKLAAVGPTFVSPETNIPYPATLYYGPFIKRLPIGNKPIEATFIIASGCLIRSDIIEKVGLMRDELFIDYIDVEWSLRAKNYGYKVFISPSATMLHTIGDSRLTILGRNISVHSPFRRYFLIRNSFLMMRLNYIPIGYKIREFIFNILRFGIGLAVSNDRKKFIKFSFQGIKDGVSGKFGPCRMKIK